MKYYKTNKGFSLIEVLITIATMSIIATMLITILSFVLRINEKVPKDIEELMSVNEAFRYMDENINQYECKKVGIKNGKIIFYPKPYEHYGEVYLKGGNLYFAYEKKGIMYPQPLLYGVSEFCVEKYGRIVHVTLKMKYGGAFEKFYESVEEK